jgi:predicted membrane-bound mannosyltransferase
MYSSYNIAALLVIIASSVVTTNVYAMDSNNSPPQSSSTVIKPDPEYSPEEVIRFQLGALAQNDIPYKNAGIEFTFSFASPSNKKATGPLERFIQLVNNPLYQPMLNHQAVQYGELQLNGDQAVQRVILTTSDGKRVAYIFTLSKQKGDSYDNCWMTDSVMLLPQLNEV